jgi:hypothetical protein
MDTFGLFDDVYQQGACYQDDQHIDNHPFIQKFHGANFDDEEPVMAARKIRYGGRESKEELKKDQISTAMSGSVPFSSDGME